MTYNEIIKTLEECGCPECLTIRDLINHQKAEIERLKKECEAHRNTIIENEKRFLEFNVEQFDEINRLVEKLKTAKSEARREFAEELKKSKCSYDLPNYHSFDAVDVDDIDNLLKELESKSNAE